MTVMERTVSTPTDHGPAHSTQWRRDQRERVGAPQRVRPLLVAFAAYLLLSVVLWWGVWSTHPTSTTTCGCGDSSLFLWFLEWPAYAITHGHNPLYSTAMFHPTGIDLL